MNSTQMARARLVIIALIGISAGIVFRSVAVGFLAIFVAALYTNVHSTT